MCATRRPDYEATISLSELRELLKDDPKSHELVDSTEEAIEFISNFYSIMFRYPPHIYISALPLAAPHLNLMKHYLQYYPRTLLARQPAHLPSFRDREQNNKDWDPLRSATLSSQGKYIGVVFKREGFKLLDAAIGDSLWASKELPSSVSFSAEDEYVAFLTPETLQLRNATTGEIERSEVFRDFRAKSVAFAPSGMYVAVGGTGGVKCWNAGKSTFLKTPQSKRAESVAFSPNGRQIISISMDRTIHIWDLSSLSLTSTIKHRHVQHQSYKVPMAVSNTRIAFKSGNIICLWVASSNQTMQLTAKRYNKTILPAPFSLSFSPNGSFLASGTEDGIDIWDAYEEKCIANIVGHSRCVHSIAFFPDGSRIMSASEDGTVRVWDIGSLLEGENEEMDNWVYKPSHRHEAPTVQAGSQDALFSAQYPFRHTRNTLVIGQCLDIDLSRFVYGAEWVRCREPLETKDGTNIRGEVTS